MWWKCHLKQGLSHKQWSQECWTLFKGHFRDFHGECYNHMVVSKTKHPSESTFCARITVVSKWVRQGHFKCFSYLEVSQPFPKLDFCCVSVTVHGLNFVTVVAHVQKIQEKFESPLGRGFVEINVPWGVDYGICNYCGMNIYSIWRPFRTKSQEESRKSWSGLLWCFKTIFWFNLCHKICQKIFVTTYPHGKHFFHKNFELTVRKSCTSTCRF